MKPLEILLVEDSPTDKLIATAALEEAKILNNLHAVEDGVEALEFLRRQGKYAQAPKPDLILLDFNLPRKDGREVLAAIKADKLLKNIPVVVLTTSQAEEDVARAYDLHANCYIVKPVEFTKFSEVIRKIESFWFEIVTLPPSHALAPLPPLPDLRRRTVPGQTVRILLLEDSPTEVIFFRDALENIPGGQFQLEVAERLADGVGKLAEEAFDIVLTDLGLPDSQGMDTFLKVQAAARGIPVVVLTSLDDESFGIWAVQAGAQDYLLKKNVAPALLARTVRYAIERRHLEDQLRQSQKLDAVGQLSSGVAHDFNNLLTVIQGNASALAQSPLLTPEDREHLDGIINAGTRAAELTRQLLAFSRKQVMQPKEAHVNTLVGHMVKMLGRLLGENIRVQIQYGSDLPPIHADVGMIEQVIMNLAVNARDAMPNGGKLTIATGRVSFQPADVAKKPGAMPGDFIELRIQDTGSGIPRENLAKIFEPFFTTKVVGKGTGLGLATVFGIVKQHRGWIDVESEVGRGTGFHVYLPAVRAPRLPMLAAEEKPKDLKGSEMILVVEDEMFIRNLVSTLLTRHQYQVIPASQGLEAIQVWDRHRDEIRLLLTDMVMPDGITGRELAERLLLDKPDLKVIFTSGYGDDIAGELRPGQAFLQKPYNMNDLLKTVRGLLDEKPAAQP